MRPLAVIFNPNARKNRSRSREYVERLRHAVGDQGTVYVTQDLQQLRSVAADLAKQRLEYLVCDGGDGTLNCALNELWSAQPPGHRALPKLLPTRGGTIDFLARKANLRGDGRTLLRALAVRLRRKIPVLVEHFDSLLVSGERLDEQGNPTPFERVGFALAAGGVGQRFFDKYEQEKRPGRRAIARVVGRAVGAHLSQRLGLPVSPGLQSYGEHLFRPTRARVSIDGTEIPSMQHGALHAGALDICLGGVFRVFPLARTPGMLHFQAGSIQPQEIIRALPDLYRGSAIRSRALYERAGHEMRIEGLGDEFLNPILDGERLTRVTRLTVVQGPRVSVPKLRVPHRRVTDYRPEWLTSQDRLW